MLHSPLFPLVNSELTQLIWTKSEKKVYFFFFFEQDAMVLYLVHCQEEEHVEDKSCQKQATNNFLQWHKLLLPWLDPTQIRNN